MNHDDSDYQLTSVGRLLQHRTKKVKTFWLKCVASSKRLNRSKSSVAKVCDGQTQTTPTLHKTIFFDSNMEMADVVPIPVASCIADSSRDSLDSDCDILKFSSESVNHDSESMNSSCLEQCMENNDNVESSKCSPSSGAIMDKLSDLHREVHLIHTKLCLLHSGDEKNHQLDHHNTSVPQCIPLPPPVPPPMPPSPPLYNSASLHSLKPKQSITKVQCDEMSTTQDRSKLVITLEELQKVKLRQVSGVSNAKPEWNAD